MAEGISAFLTPQELHKLGRLVLQSRYVVEGTLAGRHRSPFKGASSEFADHRQYMEGDDPKRIDWKVLGRTDRYFIRRYEDETNLRVYLVMDRSASMGYAHGGKSKYEYACRLAAAIGYVVLKARDSVGLYIFSDKMDAAMGPRNSFAHLNNLLRVLQQTAPASTTNTAQTLHTIAESIQRRALIVLFSDLFDDFEATVHALAHFRKQHHDVILFHTLDPAELDLPFTRGAEFEDMETKERLVVDPRALAPDYRKLLGDFLKECQDRCAQMKIDYRLVNTSIDCETFVRAYLEERRRLSR